jgi:hypothetical protein
MENPNTYSTYIRKKNERKKKVKKNSYFTFTRKNHEINIKNSRTLLYINKKNERKTKEVKNL